MRAPKQHPACSFNRNAQKIDCTLSMQSIERAALRISKRRPAKSELFCWRNKSLSLSLFYALGQPATKSKLLPAFSVIARSHFSIIFVDALSAFWQIETDGERSNPNRLLPIIFSRGRVCFWASRNSRGLSGLGENCP